MTLMARQTRFSLPKRCLVTFVETTDEACARLFKGDGGGRCHRCVSVNGRPMDDRRIESGVVGDFGLGLGEIWFVCEKVGLEAES